MVFIVPYASAAHEASSKLRTAAHKLAEAQASMLEAADTLEMFQHNLLLAKDRHDHPKKYGEWSAGNEFDELVQATEALIRKAANS